MGFGGRERTEHMFELSRGTDILSHCGGVRSGDEARELIARCVDDEGKQKLEAVSNPEVLSRIANAIALCRPQRVFVHSGSSKDRSFVRRMALECGEEESIAMPGHTCHFDLPEDQGRLINQTFYITNEEEGVSSLAKKIDRAEATEYVEETMTGIMSGRTMIVGFYSRGPVGAKATIPALEITDSFYVIHSADLLYRCGYESVDAEVRRAGLFFTNLHSKGTLRSADVAKARVFIDRSRLTTFSTYCTYAGNTLLLKKGNHRLAVDLCTYLRRGEQLSEHMFITGLRGPGGRVTFFAGAAPSGCGKTTTALVGQELIGDDLAQLWIGDDGTLRAVNPEVGTFGIVQAVNAESDPILIECLRTEGAEVIWSNILIDNHERPRWTGDGEPPPSHGRNWLGDWQPAKARAGDPAVPPSHPNARFTLANSNLPTYNVATASDPEGVPVGVITYSGRDSDTMPPVWVAASPEAGVVIGASILSAATATEVGAEGIKRQPWANAPFIPGPLSDYMESQLAFFGSPKLARKPVIAGLNYFLTEEARGGHGGKLLGEKRDVIVWLSWLERFSHGEVPAVSTPIGGIPIYEDLRALFSELIDKRYTRELYERQFALYIDNLLKRIAFQEEAYRRETALPPLILEIYAEQRSGLEALAGRFGKTVSPERVVEILGLTVA